MNPARSLGPALVSGDLSGIWIYVFAPPVGAVAAVLVYRYLRPSESTLVATPVLDSSEPDDTS